MWACSLNWINKVEVFGTEKNNFHYNCSLDNLVMCLSFLQFYLILIHFYSSCSFSNGSTSA